MAPDVPRLPPAPSEAQAYLRPLVAQTGIEIMTDMSLCYQVAVGHLKHALGLEPLPPDLQPGVYTAREAADIILTTNFSKAVAENVLDTATGRTSITVTATLKSSSGLDKMKALLSAVDSTPGSQEPVIQAEFINDEEAPNSDPEPDSSET